VGTGEGGWEGGGEGLPECFLCQCLEPNVPSLGRCQRWLSLRGKDLLGVARNAGAVIWGITQKRPKKVGWLKKARKAPLGRQDFTQEGDDRTTGGPKAGSGSGDVGRGDADGVVQRVVGEVAVHREWRGDL